MTVYGAQETLLIDILCPHYQEVQGTIILYLKSSSGTVSYTHLLSFNKDILSIQQVPYTNTLVEYSVYPY